ncbi:MAG TPA: hypothetical protein VF189_06250 [Patescibacteria group bacterium]
MLEILGIASGLISVSAYIPYIIDVIKKTTQPERASWLIWFVLTAIAFFSQLAKGASNSLWLPGIETCGLGIVLILSLKYGVGGLVKKDLLALAAAGIGLILWYFTKEPAVALYIIIGIDSIGTVLTVQKAYEDPESETFITWVLVAVAGILSMIAVGKIDIILLSYPFYIFLANAAVAFAMMIGKKPKKRK